MAPIQFSPSPERAKTTLKPCGELLNKMQPLIPKRFDRPVQKAVAATTNGNPKGAMRAQQLESLILHVAHILARAPGHCASECERDICEKMGASAINFKYSR